MLQDELPSFPALAHLAESGFLAPDALELQETTSQLKGSNGRSHAWHHY